MSIRRKMNRGIFAGIYHACHPVQRRIGIRASQAFDKSADGIEVGVAFFVVQDSPLLNAVFGHFKVDMDFILLCQAVLFLQPVQGHSVTNGHLHLQWIRDDPVASLSM